MLHIGLWSGGKRYSIHKDQFSLDPCRTSRSTRDRGRLSAYSRFWFCGNLTILHRLWCFVLGSDGRRQTELSFVVPRPLSWERTSHPVAFWTSDRNFHYPKEVSKFMEWMSGDLPLHFFIDIALPLRMTSWTRTDSVYFLETDEPLENHAHFYLLARCETVIERIY